MPPSEAAAPRLVIVPGLHDSGPAHWQTWLASRHRDALRVRQRDWSTPDLPRWAARVAAALREAGDDGAIVTAHSFGCLALVRALADDPALDVHGVLLVAPADPDRFGLGPALAVPPLRCSATLVASDTDPWLAARNARRWAFAWGCHLVNLGDAGHVNAEAGFGPLPLAERWVQAMRQRHSRARREVHASALEWSFAR